MGVEGIVVCASDAGGARNLAPLIPLLVDACPQICVLTSEAQREIFKHTHGFITDFRVGQKLTRDEIVQLYNQLGLTVVLTGTTRYPSLDRDCIAVAQQLHMWSVSVVDEWYAYWERFADPDTNALQYLPDVICLPDKLARDEAIASGLPSERCFITGSPALADLTEKASRFVNAPPQIPIELALSGEKRVVVFLSETYAKDFGTASVQHGVLGTYKGYTEISVGNAIWRVIEQSKEPVLLVEKLHPADALGYVGIHRQSRYAQWMRIKNIDLWALFWHSDAVVGMQSMGLLEAYILGCQAVSFQPGLIGFDTCTGVRLGLINRLESSESLFKWVNSCFAEESPRIIKKLPFAHSRAKQNIVELVLTRGGIYAN